jgi:hypothetical protein
MYFSLLGLPFPELPIDTFYESGVYNTIALVCILLPAFLFSVIFYFGLTGKSIHFVSRKKAAAVWWGSAFATLLISGVATYVYLFLIKNPSALYANPDKEGAIYSSYDEIIAAYNEIGFIISALAALYSFVLVSVFSSVFGRYAQSLTTNGRNIPF